MTLEESIRVYAILENNNTSFTFRSFSLIETYKTKVKSTYSLTEREFNDKWLKYERGLIR